MATDATEFRVIEEASVDTLSGTLKPDLVVVHQGRVQVIYVTFRHKDKGYHEDSHNSKASIYTPLLPLLATQLNAKPGRDLPIVVGTRGAIPKNTKLNSGSPGNH